MRHPVKLEGARVVGVDRRGSRARGWAGGRVDPDHAILSHLRLGRADALRSSSMKEKSAMSGSYQRRCRRIFEKKIAQFACVRCVYSSGLPISFSLFPASQRRVRSARPSSLRMRLVEHDILLI
jgi:hypothetical protein